MALQPLRVSRKLRSGCPLVEGCSSTGGEIMTLTSILVGGRSLLMSCRGFEFLEMSLDLGDQLEACSARDLVSSPTTDGAWQIGELFERLSLFAGQCQIHCRREKQARLADRLYLGKGFHHRFQQ